MARQRVPEGPPPAPVVQKLRIQYAKRGRLRFSSSRDFQRALERALRRANVPMAFSAGFHPHPKISYANASATGTASEAEYFEISLAERRDPQEVAALLNEALPEGLDIVTAIEAPVGALADRLEGSEWRIELPGLAAARVDEGMRVLRAQETALVTRHTKTGPRTFDVLPAILSVEPVQDGADGCAILTVVVRHATPAVRPDDILTALRAVADVEPTSPARVTRLAQGPLHPATARVTDPLVADENADGAATGVPAQPREPETT